MIDLNILPLIAMEKYKVRKRVSKYENRDMMKLTRLLKTVREDIGGDNSGKVGDPSR